MKNININKKIREILSSINESFKEQNDGISITDTDIIIDGVIGVGYDEISSKLSDVYNGVINATGYSDMMTALILEKKTKGLDEIDEGFLEILKNINCYEDLLNLYYAIPEIYSYAIKDMIRFHDSIGYHKILRFKCLSYDDIEQISKINPIFYQDFDEYNIDVNLDYIAKKITKFSEKGNNEDQLLNDGAAFITNMNKLDSKVAKKINMQMIEKSIRLINYFQKTTGNTPDSMTLVLNKFYSDLDSCINNFDFNLIKSLLSASLICVKNDKVDEVFLSKENKQLVDNIKKYELGID